MKEKMFKYFTANSTRKYVDILDKRVDRYNNTVHSSIDITPKEASEKNKEVNVRRKLYVITHLKSVCHQNVRSVIKSE